MIADRVLSCPEYIGSEGVAATTDTVSRLDCNSGASGTPAFPHALHFYESCRSHRYWTDRTGVRVSARIEYALRPLVSISAPIKVLAIIEAAVVTGPAKNLIAFARAGRETGTVSLTVATYVRNGGDNAFLQAVRTAGLPLHVIRETRAFDASVIACLRDVVARCEPDVVQTHAVKSHFLMRLSGVPRTVPWIAFHHGYTAPNIKMKLYNQLDRWSLRGPDHVVTVCQAFAEQLRRIGIPDDRMTVRHNMIGAPRVVSEGEKAALRAELQIPETAVTLVCIGRLSAEKGQLDLLEAAALLPRNGYAGEWRLVFVGDGPDRQRLEAAAMRLACDRSVVFAGHRADVGPFYGIATMVVMPSHSEGSPNVLLEALSHGVPVVATAVGGVPEIATGGEDAILVPAGSPPRLAEGIGALCRDASRRARIASAGRTVVERFTPSRYCESLAAIYRSTLALRPRRGAGM